MLLFALLACGERAEDTAETQDQNKVTETEKHRDPIRCGYLLLPR